MSRCDRVRLGREPVRFGATGGAALVAFAIGLAATSVAPAAEFGRLFSSAAERARLDALRTRAAEPEPAPVEVPVTVEPAAAEVEERPMVTVSGIVRRSDGRSTVWVNGVNGTTGDLARLGIREIGSPAQDGRVELETANDGAVRLKPGQTFDPNSGAVSDAVVDPRGAMPEGVSQRR